MRGPFLSRMDRSWLSTSFCILLTALSKALLARLAVRLPASFLHAPSPSSNCLTRAVNFFNPALFAAAKACTRSAASASFASTIFSHVSLACFPSLRLC